MSCLIELIGNTADDLFWPSEASQKVSFIAAWAKQPGSFLATHRLVCPSLSVQMCAKCLKAISQILIPGPRGHAPTSQSDDLESTSGGGDILGSGDCPLTWLASYRAVRQKPWMSPGLLPENIVLPLNSAVDEPQRLWCASWSLVTPKSETVQRNFQKAKGVLIWDEKEK